MRREKVEPLSLETLFSLLVSEKNCLVTYQRRKYYHERECAIIGCYTPIFGKQNNQPRTKSRLLFDRPTIGVNTTKPILLKLFNEK